MEKQTYLLVGVPIHRIILDIVGYDHVEEASNQIVYMVIVILFIKCPKICEVK